MTPFLKLFRVETKLFLREPVAFFFAVAFPAAITVALGYSIPAFRERSDDLGGQRLIDIYIPIVLAMAIATVAMVALLNSLAGYRERGVLRRLSTTPISPGMLLGAHLAVNVCALLVGTALAYAASVLAFDIEPPRNVPALAIAFVLGSLAMCAVALVIAAVAPSSRAASAIGSLVYFPLLFAAGVYVPTPVMPEAMRRVSDFTPLGATSQAMQDAWAGGWPQPLHLAVMATTTVVLEQSPSEAFGGTDPLPSHG